MSTQRQNTKRQQPGSLKHPEIGSSAFHQCNFIPPCRQSCSGIAIQCCLYASIYTLFVPYLRRAVHSLAYHSLVYVPHIAGLATAADYHQCLQYPPDHTNGMHSSTFPLDSARHLAHHRKPLCVLCHQSCCLHATSAHQPHGLYPVLQTPCARQTALERQDLSRTYLAHHELESKFSSIIIIICCYYYHY